MLQMIGAVTYDGVSIKANGINLTINFTSPWNASQMTIDADWIYAENFTNGEYYYDDYGDWTDIGDYNMSDEDEVINATGLITRFQFLKEDGNLEENYTWNGNTSEGYTQIRFWYQGIAEGNYNWTVEPTSVGYPDQTFEFTQEYTPGVNITFNLTQNHLGLSFEYNGTANVTSGWISDLEKSRNFTAANYTIPMANLTRGLVEVRFGMIEGGNHTQYFEFINTYDDDINETLEILNASDWYSYFKVTDQANTPLENATIRAEMSWFGITPGQWVYHKLFGQRITRDDGLTFFYADVKSEVMVTVTKDGYAPVQMLITIGDTEWTASNPYIIKMQQVSGISDNAAYYYVPNSYYDASKNIYGFIMAVDKDSVKWTTSHRTSLGMASVDVTYLEDVTYRYPLTLVAGRDFSIGTPNEINLSIYIDNALWKTRTIEYSYYNGSYFYTESEQGRGHNTTIHLERDSNTFEIEDSILNPILFILVILLTFSIGAMTKNDNIAETVFKFGSAGLVLISTQFVWLTLLVAVHYVALGLRKVISE